MGETNFLCTETICYIREAQANEAVDFEGKVNENPLLKEVQDGNKVLRNSYLTIYGEPEDVRKCERALRLIKLELAKLGYHFDNLDDSAVSAKVIYDFQRLCGIYDGERGTLIGTRTIKALITASKAGKSWKRKVAGMHDETPPINTIALKGVKERLSKLVVEKGLNLRDVGKDERIEPVREAYAILGLIKFEKVVEAEDFIFANYKFQIISGANEKRNLAASFGPATHRALLKAIKAVEQGRDWRKAW